MNKPTRHPAAPTAPKARKRPSSAGSRIHPVVIYPFNLPDDPRHLKCLYQLAARLAAQPETYARPITVIDRKTSRRMAAHVPSMRFRREIVEPCSDVVDAWCVDTCQMWYAGLGLAFDRGQSQDVYWLIPGDFNYGSSFGQEVLGRLHDLPEICLELKQDVCIGEIHTTHDNPKQLIDTYGTFSLLYHWFPAEAREIREYTERPRSEFFALRHEFLGELLHRRWYAYEQTVVTLLHAIFDHKHISRFFVGEVTDLPEGRENLAAALQQIERTERVLKTLWLERHQAETGWLDRYRVLETQSDQIRLSALSILANLLEK